MNNEFEQLLSRLLEDSKAHNGKDAAVLATELELSDENKQMLEEAFSCIDKISDGLDKLHTAKSEGMSRRKWVMQQMEDSMKDYSVEEKSQVIAAIGEQLDEIAEQSIEEEDA